MFPFLFFFFCLWSLVSVSNRQQCCYCWCRFSKTTRFLKRAAKNKLLTLVSVSKLIVQWFNIITPKAWDLHKKQTTSVLMWALILMLAARGKRLFLLLLASLICFLAHALISNIVTASSDLVSVPGPGWGPAFLSSAWVQVPNLT